MRPAHWRASLAFILVFAFLSVNAAMSTKAPGAGDGDEPVVLPIVKTASTDQRTFKPKSVTIPSAREPACVSPDFRLSVCLTPTEHPRPQAPDPSPFA